MLKVSLPSLMVFVIEEESQKPAVRFPEVLMLVFVVVAEIILKCFLYLITSRVLLQVVHCFA